MLEPLPPGAQDEGRGYWISANGTFFDPQIKLIFVNPAEEITDGSIVVVAWPAEPLGVIRRVQLHGDSVMFTPILPPYTSATVKRRDVVRMERVSYTKL